MEGTVFIGNLTSGFNSYKTTCAYQPSRLIFFNANREVVVSEIKQVAVTTEIIQFDYQGEKYCLTAYQNDLFEPLRNYLLEVLN